MGRIPYYWWTKTAKAYVIVMVWKFLQLVRTTYHHHHHHHHHYYYYYYYYYYLYYYC